MKKILFLLLFLPLIASAQLELPFSVKVLNPKPLDAKYFNIAGTTYTNTAEVISQLTSGLRYEGLTVSVSNVEYWFYNGIADGDLVVKTPASGWSLLGNAGTVDGTNFIGTTDNIPFNIRVNNEKSGRIEATSDASTFFGYQAGNVSNANRSNVGIGYQSLLANTSGGANTATGIISLFSNTTGTDNTATGALALQNNTTASNNAAFGSASLTENTTGHSNTAIGTFSLQSNTTGINNTALGRSSLITNTTGSTNTGIGRNSDVGANNLTNATAIGNGAIVTASNFMQLGNASVTQVNIGTSTTAKLVAGGLQVTGGTLGVNRVLTSDASGNATWEVAASGFSDPMTTRGDIIIRNASNTTARLAIGTAGQVPTSDGTDISWSTPTAATLTTPRTIGITTGDVTSAGSSFDGSANNTNALTIANDAVTYAKMQNVSAASRLLGRGDSGSGDPQEITIGSGLTMTGTTLSASGGSGTVTNVSSANADATVATQTTTPVITIVNSPAVGGITITGTPSVGQSPVATSGTAATWQTPASGFADPMTTRGDLIFRNASNVTARLARGTATQVLTSDGTDISWSTPSGGGGWATTGATALTGAVDIQGTTTNTIKYSFPSLGTTLIDGAGLWLQNTTAAAPGLQQISPILTLEGRGWKTNATAASQPVKTSTYVLPVQGSINPTLEHVIAGSINGAAYGNMARFVYDGTAGSTNFFTGLLEINNTNSTATTLFRGNRYLDFTTGSGPTGATWQSNFTSPLGGITTGGGIARFLGTFTRSSGTNAAQFIKIQPTINTTSTYAGIGIAVDIDPVLTSTTGYTNLVLRTTSGQTLLNGTTVTAATTLDVRGISGGSIHRLASDANTERFDFLNDGSLQIGGNTGTSGQMLTSAGAGNPVTWTTPSGGGVTSVTSANANATVATTTTTPVITIVNSPAVGGITITGTPNVGQVPTATSGTAATWQNPSIRVTTAKSVTETLIMNYGALSSSGSGITSLGVNEDYSNSTVLIADITAFGIKSDGTTSVLGKVTCRYRKNSSGTFSVDAAGTAVISDTAILASIVPEIASIHPDLRITMAGASGTYNMTVTAVLNYVNY